MSAPRAHTAALERVRKLADLALDDPKGIDISILVSTYGSMDACAQLARSFQQSFTSLRARNRKQDNASKLADPVSKYDALICQRLPMPNDTGWSIRLIREDTNLLGWEITSLATGQPVTQVVSDDDAYERLAAKLQATPQRFTVEDRMELERIAPTWAEVQITGDTSWAKLHGTAAPSLEDLVNAPDADIFGVGQ